MLVRSVLLILLISHPKWSGQQNTEDPDDEPAFNSKPYECNTHAQIMEIEQLNLKRLAYSYMHNMLFLFLDDKVIHFSTPRMTKDSDEDGKYSLVVTPSYFIDRSEHPKDIFKGKMFGHLYRIGREKTVGPKPVNTERVLELFLEEPKDPQSDRFEFKERATQIDMKGTPGALETDTVEPTLLEPFNWKKEYVECWANAIRYGETNFLGEEYISLQFTYCNQTSFPPIKMFAMWLRSFDPAQLINVTTFLITADKPQVLMSDKRVNYTNYHAWNETYSVFNSFEVGPIPLTEYLSCQTTFSKVREIKGFWYYDKHFYAFFSRYYLIVEMNAKEYPLTLKAHRLPIDFEEKGVNFEILRTKWIKVLGPKVYLAPHVESNTVYEIQTVSTDRQINKLKRMENPPRFDCPGNTLLVEGNLYCFSGRHSY